MTTDQAVCIHGHFYQPPRENPWLEAVERQDSARPYHDWNQRIAAECYAPNAKSRVLDESGRIAKIVNNYARIAYDVGPTLLSWMESSSRETYEQILVADRESAERFSGHGSAIAQGYNHAILPLCNDRDRRTQVRWGLRDFEHRFGRKAEGMWLPETAADTATLEVLAEEGVKFTVLAPRQCRQVRPPGGEWTDTDGVDPRRVYRVPLPSGRSIAVFFYDGPVSQAIAFEGLLRSGERFADRLLGTLDEDPEEPQLANIATDGETYGHHFKHGDRALAWALERIETSGGARLTNHGEWLEQHPPEWEAAIHENSSWSCVHGVERWKANCGCRTHPEWEQHWRAPLRMALDWLRDELAPRYEHAAGRLVTDPWAARDAYVEVILDRSPETEARFLADHARHELNEQERVALFELLELQRHAMLMYTSCGWFFDEISGLETVQVLHYAGRALQLARSRFGVSLEEEFVDRLRTAPSNLPEIGDGGVVWDRFVRPAMLDLEKVAAHFAVSFPFESYGERTHVYGFPVELEDAVHLEAGRARLAYGRVRITSGATGETRAFAFGVLYFGDHNLLAGVKPDLGEDWGERMRDAAEAFRRSELPLAINGLQRAFGGATVTLRSLFRDEQRRVLDAVLRETLEDAETTYRQLYEHHAPLMRFLIGLDQPLPRPFRTAADHALGVALERALAEPEPDVERVRTLLAEVRDLRVQLDTPVLGFALAHALQEHARAVVERPDDSDAVHRAAALAALIGEVPFEVDLWKTQNEWWTAKETVLPGWSEHSAAGDEDASRRVAAFLELGRALGMRVEDLAAAAAPPAPPERKAG